MSGRLDIRGPARLGALALAGLLAAGLLAAAELPNPDGFALAEVELVDRRVHQVRHGGGVIGRVLVTAGQTVAAGDLIATIEAEDIDSRIGALKAQSSMAQVRLESVRREAQAFNAMLAQRLVTRDKVAALEARVAELEREAATVLSLISEAEQQLARVEIRAPIGGTILALPGLIAGRSIGAGETLAEIEPDQTRLMLEGHLTPRQASGLKVGTAVKVWLGPASWADARPLPAHIAWIAPEAEAAAAGGPGLFATRVELRAHRDGPLAPIAAIPGLKPTLVLPDSTRPIWQQLLDPIRRAAGKRNA